MLSHRGWNIDDIFDYWSKIFTSWQIAEHTGDGMRNMRHQILWIKIMWCANNLYSNNKGHSHQKSQ